MSRLTLSEASDRTGLSQTRIVMWIEREWIIPQENSFLDEEDLARIQLIEDLLSDFGINDEAVPLILHLVDQLNALHRARHRERTLLKERLK